MKKILTGLLVLGSLSVYANNDHAVCKQAIVGNKTDNQEVCATITNLSNGRYVLELKTDIAAFDMVNESGERTNHQSDICELFDLKEAKSSGLVVLVSARMAKKASFLGGGSLISEEAQIVAIDKMICIN